MRKSRHQKATGATQKARTPRKKAVGSHTFTIQKGWCTPARFFVDKAFTPLGIRAKWGGVVLNYEKDPDTGKDRIVPSDQTQDVTVSAAQATWAEYVLGAVCGQVDMNVTAGIMDVANFQKGMARKGVPLPWLYSTLKDAPKDDARVCMKSLPPAQQKDAAEAIKRGEISLTPSGIFRLKFTSEGQKRGQKGREGSSTSKRTGKTGKASQGPSVASRKATKTRGSHRGRHRGR